MATDEKLYTQDWLEVDSTTESSKHLAIKNVEDVKDFNHIWICEFTWNKIRHSMVKMVTWYNDITSDFWMLNECELTGKISVTSAITNSKCAVCLCWCCFWLDVW